MERKHRVSWRIWIRKHCPFLRPRSKFKTGEMVERYGEGLYRVKDPRIDHCGQILLWDMSDRGLVCIDPDKLNRVGEST